MIKLKLNIPYNRPIPKSDSENILSDSELTVNYLNFAVEKKYPNGLKGIVLRTFARIQNKMDTAILDQQDYIELDATEFDLLKESIKNDELEFPAGTSKYVVLLIDEFDEILKAQ